MQFHGIWPFAINCCPWPQEQTLWLFLGTPFCCRWDPRVDDIQVVIAKSRNGSCCPLERKYYELNTRWEVTNVKQYTSENRELGIWHPFPNTHRPTTVYPKEENEMVIELRLCHMKNTWKFWKIVAGHKGDPDSSNLPAAQDMLYEDDHKVFQIRGTFENKREIVVMLRLREQSHTRTTLMGCAVILILKNLTASLKGFK